MDEVNKILDANSFCTISTVTGDGKPWASPVFFAYEDGPKIYWWSDQESTHSKNIKANNEVFITVFNSQVSENDAIGVYIKAKARPLDDVYSRDKAIKFYNKRAKFFELTEENTSGNAPTRLYIAEPEQIWLNSEGTKDGFYVDTRRRLK